MRQVVAFRMAMQKRITTTEYNRMAFQAKLQGREIKPLDEFLGVGSEESPFDPATDAALTKRAEALLEQRRKMVNV